MDRHTSALTFKKWSLLDNDDANVRDGVFITDTEVLAVLANMTFISGTVPSNSRRAMAGRWRFVTDESCAADEQVPGISRAHAIGYSSRLHSCH